MLRPLPVLLLAVLVVLGPRALAQLAVAPQSLSVAVPQHETVERTVTLTNTGSESLAFCLSFDRPLQRATDALRLAEGAAGGDEPCGAYGEILYSYDEADWEGDGGGTWDPSSMTMAPDGRLLVAEPGGLHRTLEFTPALEFVRSFVHPFVAEFEPFPAAWGITYDTESGTLWWMNGERRSVNGQQTTFRILLLEGDLDGEETGRRIEIVPPETPLEDFFSSGLSYEPASGLFYFLGISDVDDSSTRKVWAVNHEGSLAEGYPLRPEPYPPPALIGDPEAHGGAEGGVEGVRVEFAVYPSVSAPGFDRVVVMDRWGNSEGEALETPVPPLLFEGNGAGLRANPLRSRIDPNGVMYMTFVNFDDEGIVGVRPHPLPPSWLIVDSDEGPEAAWDGTLAPGESREVTLTFRAGARAIGEYTSALQAFEAATGEAVAVPLSLTVTEGTNAEEGPAKPESALLSVHPNPTSGAATATLSLPAPETVQVAVFDVLGREVAVLHDGPLAAGSHRLALDGRSLPAGLYVVRVVGDAFTATQRFTLVR